MDQVRDPAEKLPFTPNESVPAFSVENENENLVSVEIRTEKGK